MKKNSGFTLIELVVVMAILAILAGVAVPAYSGYIKKANEAADQQKIEAVETAMASALAMEGYDKIAASTYFDVAINDKTVTVTGDNLKDGATNKVWNNFKTFYGLEDNATCTITLKEKTVTDIYGVTKSN